MIIDLHVHMAIEGQRMWTPRVWDLLYEQYPERSGDIRRYETDPGRFRKDLQSVGIDRVVLLAEDSIETGLVPNDYILEYSRDDSDFYVPFLALNPNRTGSFRDRPSRFEENVRLCCDRLEQLAEQGFRGIKDYGSYNHLPFGAEAMLPFYEKGVELNLPILFHTGVSMFDSETSVAFASPEGLGELASTFPDLTIIIGHGGGRDHFGTAYGLAKRHANVYLEVSGIPPHRVPHHFFERGFDLNRIPEKLVFGSDYPALPNGLEGIGKNIESYRALGKSGILSTESLEGLLGANAHRILSGRDEG